VQGAVRAAVDDAGDKGTRTFGSHKLPSGTMRRLRRTSLMSQHLVFELGHCRFRHCPALSFEMLDCLGWECIGLRMNLLRR
jgi:hypothetical protein